MNPTIPSRLTDRDLVAAVARLAESERDATAALIAHLAELYARRLHERAGFSSLFTYCMEVLHLSEHEAYDRMKAAKVARRYPAVPGLLASGRVNLTTIRLLAPHLSRTNHEELFAAASGKRKRQVQELLAQRFPKPDVPSSVRKLPARNAAPVAPVAVPAATSASPSAGAALMAAASGPPIPPPRELVRPLAPDRYQITFTATKAICEKLEVAQDLLRHAVPNGDSAHIFERALDALIEHLVKEKYATTSRPRTSPGQAKGSRHIPAEVRRAVFIRDRGRCAFVGTGTRRCGERGFVEFHHLVPYAVGGPPTADNIELRCRAHNDYEAELFYGPGKSDGRVDAVREPIVTHGRVIDDAFSFRNDRRGPQPNDHRGGGSSGVGPVSPFASRSSHRSRSSRWAARSNPK